MTSFHLTATTQLLLLIAVCLFAISFHGTRGALTSIPGDSEPGVPQSPGDDGGSDRDGETGRRDGTGQLSLPDNMSSEDMLSVLCDQLQTVIPECSTVPTMEERFGKSRDGREKRDVWNPFSPFPRYGYESVSSDNSIAYVCPTQTDYSAIYHYSNDSTYYPANDVSAELHRDPALFACLIREVILQNAPPSSPVDSFLSDSDASCPFEELRLWSYQSQIYQSRCWVLPYYQEVITYKVCMSQYPNNCKQASQLAEAKHADPWDWDPWTGSHNQRDPAANSTKPINKCIVQNNIVSLWAYCPNLLVSKIVRDRIVVPTACTPYAVPCKAVGRW